MLKRILIGLAALVALAGVAIGITLYSTTGMDGRPLAASGLVIAGAAAREAAGPRPVPAWGHGTIGVARGCAVSLLARPSVALVRPMDRILDQGWVVVAPDYVGLGGPGAHPYLAGEVTGRSVVDGVRAARALDTAWSSTPGTPCGGVAGRPRGPLDGGGLRGGLRARPHAARGGGRRAGVRPRTADDRRAPDDAREAAGGAGGQLVDDGLPGARLRRHGGAARPLADPGDRATLPGPEPRRGGGACDFRTYPRGHRDIMESAGPELLDWTRRLFAGAAVPAGCPTG